MNTSKRAVEPDRTTGDVEALLTLVVGSPETLASIVAISKERGKNNCLIKPKRVIPYPIWLQIQTQVKKLGGRWVRKERLWEVPLNG